MWPVSQKYLDTLPRAHTQVAYVEIIRDGVSVATVGMAGNAVYTDPSSGSKLYLVDGSVNVDKTTIRRSGTVTFSNPGGGEIPDSVADLLAPWITELRCWIGVRYWDAPEPVGFTGQTSGQLIAGVPATDVEYVPVGTLVITSLDTANYPEIVCQCYDRTKLLANFPAPYQVAAGTDVVTAVTGLLSANIPAARLVLNFPDSSEFTVPASTFDSDTPIADQVYAVASIAGWNLLCDPMGAFSLVGQPSTDDDPVLSLMPAPRTSVMRPHKTIGQGDEMFNAVVYTGEAGTTTPVRGYAEDDNPSSLTYVGRVGVRPYFASSPVMTTVDQCNQAAATVLNNLLGVSIQLTVPIIPNHALESGDVIHVTDTAQRIDEAVIVDSFTVAFKASAGAMLLNCRENVVRL